jgi:ABC-type lipoprotein release transport system permease subunit
MVVRDGLGYTATGLGAGVVAALALNGTLRGLVYDVSTTDPLTYVAVAAAVLAASTLASLIPAYRASRADPTIAMRREA